MQDQSLAQHIDLEPASFQCATNASHPFESTQRDVNSMHEMSTYGESTMK